MKIYQLIIIYNTGTWSYGYFSSKEKAKEYISELSKSQPNTDFVHFIVDHEVDHELDCGVSNFIKKEKK